MAANFTERIEELEQERRKNKREAKRARGRRLQYLRQGKWKEAREAREVARKNNAQAQENLKRIRTLRRERSEASRLARILRHNRKVLGASGVSWYDGRKVAAWMVPYLQWARQNGWHGRLVSGWRDPHYSQQLCYAMCGRPSCPGRCAGLSSNHVGSAKPRGAVDVSDFYRFGQIMQRCPYSPRLINRLDSRDPVHYSVSGS